eukprot:gnl/TRDRNA2_/TRDRNA2_88021_c1_seq1.p1 gnl/TRDRNA2_/TRDRNA2_88021_c1~~gnl/TRDRNA2_/TRDRNA2_88021_c1_seq1.p1  ORF type:complete len:341 (-),score=45.14 gnl/TRDRNA2_/TRDRNA2_88021_c1_seq1:36-923(-)
MAGVEMPRIIYDTVWLDKEYPRDHARSMIMEGFRGFHVLDMPELQGAFGAVIEELRASGGNVDRDDFFIQTEITYGPQALHSPNVTGLLTNGTGWNYNVTEQVDLAVKTLLRNFGMGHVDSLVLKLPSRAAEDLESPELHAETMEAWYALENAVLDGSVRQLGISNYANLDHLKKIYEDARFKPSVVKELYYGDEAFTTWNRNLIRWCSENGMLFQSNWTLTYEAASPTIRDLIAAISLKYNRSPHALLIRFLMSIGTVPLTGDFEDPRMMTEELLAWRIPIKNVDISLIDKFIS